MPTPETSLRRHRAHSRTLEVHARRTDKPRAGETPSARRQGAFFFKQKTAYEITRSLEFRRVLFRSDTGEGDEAPDKPPQVVALDRFYAFCNDTQDIRQILRNAIAALIVFGDALLEVGWDGPTPVGLWNLDVPTTYPRADQHGQITGWVQQTDLGQTADFEPREVIHISMDSARPGING